MRGRKPTPNRLKLLRGNPGRRPLNKNEPAPRPLKAAPRPPTFLNRRAAAEWRRIARELVELRLLTSVDHAALAGYCDCFAEAAEASELLKKTPGLTVTGPNGTYANPLLRIRRQAFASMRSFLVEFGLTPSSRSRVSAPAPEKSEDRESRATNPIGQDR
jgi:P27 family predicted phage terminase small subunit